MASNASTGIAQSAKGLPVAPKTIAIVDTIKTESSPQTSITTQPTIPVASKVTLPLQGSPPSQAVTKPTPLPNQSTVARNGTAIGTAEAEPSPVSQETVYIAVMGQTGTGKTTFISKATGLDLSIGHELESCTQHVEEFETTVDGRTVKLIDTPGFDDGARSDSDILENIAYYLKRAHDSKIYVTGIIYLHRITDPRMGGSAVRNLRLLKKICGPDFYGNLVLATIRWNEVSPEEGERRERGLRTKDTYWEEFIKQGATIRRHDDERESAIRIIRHLLKKTPVVLRFQRELAEHGIVAKTAVGEELISYLAEMSEKSRIRIAQLEKELEEERSARAALEGEIAALSQKVEDSKRDMENLKKSLGERINEDDKLKELEEDERQNKTHKWPQCPVQ